MEAETVTLDDNVSVPPCWLSYSTYETHTHAHTHTGNEDAV